MYTHKMLTSIALTVTVINNCMLFEVTALSDIRGVVNNFPDL